MKEGNDLEKGPSAVLCFIRSYVEMLISLVIILFLSYHQSVYAVLISVAGVFNDSDVCPALVPLGTLHNLQMKSAIMQNHEIVNYLVQM